MSLRVHSIETFGTHDGPGVRMVVFLQGCNFRCLYCQNPDSQTIHSGQEMSVETILTKLEREREYLGPDGGITISGGEPTLQSKHLIPLFQSCQAMGIHTALDTNGSILTPESRELLGITDLLLLDVKHIDDDFHQKLTSQPNLNPLSTATIREESGKPMWLRYVLVPGWNDAPDILHRFGKYFSGYKTIKRLQILPYHTLGIHKYRELNRPYPLEGISPPTGKSVHTAQNILSQYISHVTIR